MSEGQIRELKERIETDFNTIKELQEQSHFWERECKIAFLVIDEIKKFYKYGIPISLEECGKVVVSIEKILTKLGDKK
jgi:hypothetical protein